MTDPVGSSVEGAVPGSDDTVVRLSDAGLQDVGIAKGSDHGETMSTISQTADSLAATWHRNERIPLPSHVELALCLLVMASSDGDHVGRDPRIDSKKRCLKATPPQPHTGLEHTR